MENSLLALLEDYLPEWIISGAIIILVILFLFKKVRETFVNWSIFNFLKRKTIKLKDLQNHQFFIFIEYMEKYKIDLMEFGDVGRTKIFREYFKIRCQTFHDHTKALISENVLDLSPQEVKTKMFDTLYTSIQDTNKIMLDECNNDEERFIVQFIVDKFASHADGSVEAFKSVIENIFDSAAIYSNNIERLNTMLNLLLFVFIATFAETEKVLHMINGDVSGKNYKGIILK